MTVCVNGTIVFKLAKIKIYDRYVRCFFINSILLGYFFGEHIFRGSVSTIDLFDQFQGAAMVVLRISLIRIGRVKF